MSISGQFNFEAPSASLFPAGGLTHRFTREVGEPAIAASNGIQFNNNLGMDLG